MKFLEKLVETGNIPTYRIENDVSNLCLTYNKPSARVLKSEIGLKTIALLKQIEENNNHSWYQEIKDRNINNLNKIALFYRGNKITYGEMFDKVDKYSKSLVSLGIKKGDEIPCCLANTPELVYTMLAANRIGAKLNLMGTNLNKEYMKNILDDCSKKLFITTDNNYHYIKDTINSIPYENKLVFSLADSLPENPELCDEYEPELKEYYHYDNLVETIKKSDDIISANEFEQVGENYEGNIIDDNNLETEFLITYTSGSTRNGYPKQIIHSNRSYIIGGIYNDTNLTGSPSVPEIRGMAHIHSDSNTNLITCISDNLIKRGCVALEPEYDKEKLLDLIILNKPVHLDATTSFLIEAAKQYLIEKKHHKDGKGKKMPYLLVAMAIGEKTSPGEEKFINRFLREASAGSGIKLNGKRLPFAPMSVGGGDCEHGGIYYTLLKGLQTLINFRKNGKREYGLTPVPFAAVTALKINDQNQYEECDYEEYGLIVANSVTNMVKYKNDHEKTKEKIIRDKYGRDWVSCDVYGKINKLGNVIVKGRTNDVIRDFNGNEIANYMIDDVVCLDTKNIMSCSTVKVEGENGDIPVINIEFSPYKKKSMERILSSLEDRCNKKLPKYINNNMVVRIIDSSIGYPLTGSGKRDIKKLEQFGLENTYRIKNGVLIPYKKKNSKEKKKILK